VERKYRMFYEIIDNTLHYFPACFFFKKKLKAWIFFGLLNCEKFDACKLQCIFPDQFILKMGRIYEGEFERASVQYELQFRKY